MLELLLAIAWGGTVALLLTRAVVQYRHYEVLRPEPIDSAETKSVSVIIPARNEADVIGRAISSLINQDVAALFLVDDNSADGTANAALAAARMSAFSDKLTVLRGTELPAGWTGKVWAMHQGCERARTLNPDYILLTDADIEHSPGNLAQLIAQAERGSYDLDSDYSKDPVPPLAADSAEWARQITAKQE